MQLINHHAKYRIDTVVDQLLKVADRLFFTQLKMEPLLYLENSLIRFNPNIRDVRVYHEREQVEDKVCRFSERCVGGETMLLEL